MKKTPLPGKRVKHTLSNIMREGIPATRTGRTLKSTCRACLLPPGELLQLDQALRNGDSERSTAARFKVTQSTVHRHAKNHLTAAPPPVPVPPVESELLAELRQQLRSVKMALAQALKGESPDLALKAVAASTTLLGQIQTEEAKAPAVAGKKATKITAETRLETVFEMLVKGETRAKILQYASDWDLTDRQIDEYISRANERFRETSHFDREAQIGETIERYREQYRLATEREDHKGAATIQEKLARLLGLEAPSVVKNEHSGPAGGPILIERVIPDDELRSRLREYLDASPDQRLLDRTGPETDRYVQGRRADS